MSFPGLTSCTPIGLDIGGRHVKAVQLNRTSRGWHVKAAAVLPRRGTGAGIDAQEIQAIRSVLARQGFSGTRAVLAVPAEKLLRGIVELGPVESGAPIDQLARMEFARVHNCDPQSFEMVYWLLPHSPARKGRSQLLAAACAHDDADALLDVVEGAGLDVQVLDVHSSALVRACGPLLSEAGKIVAILDIAWRCCQLLLVHQGAVIYERSLPEAGMQRLCEALARQLNLEQHALDVLLTEVGLDGGKADAEDAGVLAVVQELLSKHFGEVVEELRIPLSYAAQQYPGSAVEQLLLVGGGSAIPGLDVVLGSALGVDTRMVSPADLAECPAPLLARCSTGALTGALGLAQFMN